MIGRLLSTIRRFRGRSPQEFYFRATQKVSAWRERAALNFGTPQPAARLIAGADATAAQVLSQAQPFFAGVEHCNATVAALRLHTPSDESEILERAAAVVRGEISIFGHGLVQVGAPPVWNRDPIAGLSAPHKHWSAIPYLNPAIVGDHKVVWEFNRHQYFVTLGQAWQYSRNELWPHTFAEHLQSWIEKNPASVGMNWASSLEVAYRAISWMWAFQLMRESGVLQGVVAEKMLASVQSHGEHLEKYLSTYFSPNTHLTGEALGLFYIGVTCPMLRDADRWKKLGARVLESSLSRQLLSDGVYFEQASLYHRYTIEIFLHYLLLAGSAGWQVSNAVIVALHKSFDVLLHLTRADGTIPLIGDDDGGRLVQLDSRPPHDVRALLAMGAVVLQRSDLAWAGRGDDAALCWMLGAEAARERDALLKGPPAATARAFRDGGLFTMRDGWNPRDGHMAIDAGPHGALSFGHSHADALSVELAVGGKSLFADAGTFTYVGAERDAFRITAAHNTVEVDGESTCIPATPFRWKEVSSPHATSWVAEADFDYFSGLHDSYGRLASPVRHQRSIFHPAAGVWIVQDDIITAGEHDVVLRWRCARDVHASLRSNGNGYATIGLTRSGTTEAALLLAGGASGNGAIRKGWISEQFGKKGETDVCSWHERVSEDATLVSVVIDLERYEIDFSAPASEAPTAGEAFTVGLRARSAPESRIMILAGTTQSVTLGNVAIDARFAFVQMTADVGKVTRVIAAAVKQLSVDGIVLHQNSAGDTWVVASINSTGSAPPWTARSGSLKLTTNA